MSAKPSRTLKRLGAQLRGAVGRCIDDYRMIAAGDRVMVCLSGGKDSYTLLDILLSLQRSAPVNHRGKSRSARLAGSPSSDTKRDLPGTPVRFELLAVNLDQKQPEFPAHVLPAYLEPRGVPYRVIAQDTYSVVKRVVPPGRTLCGLCSRLRRGALYRFAAENGITKIALGHHRDDIVRAAMEPFQPAAAGGQGLGLVLAALELPPRVITGMRLDERGTPVATTMQAADGSWAEVELAADEHSGRIVRGSSADLWAAVERAYTLWHELGDPGWDSFGLTSAEDEQRIWFDDQRGRHTWPVPPTCATDRRDR